MSDGASCIGSQLLRLCGYDRAAVAVVPLRSLIRLNFGYVISRVLGPAPAPPVLTESGGVTAAGVGCSARSNLFEHAKRG
jgi:hypothetical protein